MSHIRLWLSFSMYWLLLMLLVGSETFIWNQSCIERTDSLLRRENCLHSLPSRSFSFHPSPSTGPRSTNKWFIGLIVPWVHQDTGWLILHSTLQEAVPNSARCSHRSFGCSGQESKTLECFLMDHEHLLKVVYMECGSQASDWPKVSSWMSVIITIF